MIWENKKISSLWESYFQRQGNDCFQTRLGTGLPRELNLPFSHSTAELWEPSRGTEAKFGDTDGFVGGLGCAERVFWETVLLMDHLPWRCPGQAHVACRTEGRPL